MELYFAPLACSMAARIVVYETGASAAFIRVDPSTKRTERGEDLRAINPLGLVPTLRTDHGEILTENAAILQYLADMHPGARLAPAAGIERARLQQWLSFIGTELHKSVFNPLLDAHAPEAAKRHAIEKSASRLSIVERHLEGRDHLLGDFSVADAYLVVVLGWTVATSIRLESWKALAKYARQLRDRSSVARAFAEERALYGRPIVELG